MSKKELRFIISITFLLIGIVVGYTVFNIISLRDIDFSNRESVQAIMHQKMFINNIESNGLHSHGHMLPHSHNISEGTISVDESSEPPSISLSVFKDATDGWNLHIDVKGFKISSPDSPDGDGYINLYINGDKVTKIYGNWYHIPSGWLAGGTHNIKVNLSNNNGKIYYFKDRELSDAKIIEVK